MSARPLAFLALFLGALLAAPAARAHPLHTAHADVELNRRTGRLEIAVRVIADDFLAALNAGRAQSLNYERTPAAELDAACLAYATAHLVLTPAAGDGTAPAAARLAWVGREFDAEGMHQRLWLYFEAPWTGDLAGARVRFTALLASFARQENTVRLRDGSRAVTLAFDPAHEERVVAFAP